MTRPIAPASKGGLIGLVGPTAVGKSEVALHLAERLNGEIISVDSMQVYRGLDVGTAKPSKEERTRVRHHLISVVDIATPFDAAQFVRLANQAVMEIASRGHLSILCGGTGLYFKAFSCGLGEAPPASDDLRAKLEATPLSELLGELQKSDPLTYERIDRQNIRRVIRAIEVIRLTGKPYSAQRANWAKSAPSEHRLSCLFGLERSSVDLHQRIEARVDAMFKQGLVAETEALLRAGLANNRTAQQALGYRQVVEFLNGVRSLPETVALIKARTRQYAKRQMTWFRRQLPVQWLSVTPKERTENIIDKLAAKLVQ